MGVPAPKANTAPVPKFEVSITVDWNDADYVTDTHEVDQEKLNKLTSITDKIKTSGYGKKRWGYKWENGDRGSPGAEYPDLTEEEVEFLNDLLPYVEYGVHTITEIVWYPMPEKMRLL